MKKELTAEEKQAREKKIDTMLVVFCIVLACLYAATVIFFCIWGENKFRKRLRAEQIRDDQTTYIHMLLAETPSEDPNYCLYKEDAVKDPEGSFACVSETAWCYLDRYAKIGETVIDERTITTSSGQEICVDNQYLMDKNQFFYKLINSERYVSGKEPRDTATGSDEEFYVYAVFAFDNEIFIAVVERKRGIYKSLYDMTVLFRFVAESQTVLYVDFEYARMDRCKIAKIKTEGTGTGTDDSSEEREEKVA